MSVRSDVPGLGHGNTTRQVAAIAVLMALAAVLLAGCKVDTTGLSTLSVAEMGHLLERNPELMLCDANNAKTRARYGVLPGARMLSSYRDYPLVELPADKARGLVFYCHSEMCGAAASAARRALAAGHRNVYVMPAGIRGWVEAGHPVERAPSGNDEEAA